MNTLITKATVGCVVFAAMAMANAAEAKTCRSEYLKHYVHGPSHKAMATTGGRNPSRQILNVMRHSLGLWHYARGHQRSFTPMPRVRPKV